MERLVTEKDVSFFKENTCDENNIIINIINEKLQDYFLSPILDVGYGLGDIAYHALKNKQVIGIDINNVSEDEYPLRKNHKRITLDFFNYSETEKIKTLFISHTLQFLHNNMDELNKQIVKINAEIVILIANRNNDFLGKIIDWTQKNFKNSSPELRIKSFPPNYKLIREEPFIANLKCKSFDDLAEQVSYLMLIDITHRKQEVVEFLKKNLNTPEFTINQDILIYERQ